MVTIQIVETDDVLEAEALQNEEITNQLSGLDKHFKDFCKKAIIMTKEQPSERKVMARAIKRSCRDVRKEIKEMCNLLKEVDCELNNQRNKQMEAAKMVTDHKLRMEELGITDEADNPGIDQSTLELEQAKALDVRNENLAKLKSTRTAGRRSEQNIRRMEKENYRRGKTIVHNLKRQRDQAELLALVKLPVEEMNDERKNDVQKGIDRINTMLYGTENSICETIKKVEKEVAEIKGNRQAIDAGFKGAAELCDSMHSTAEMIYQEKVRDLQKQIDLNNFRSSMQDTLEILQVELMTAHLELKLLQDGRNKTLNLVERQMERINKKFEKMQPIMSALQVHLQK